MELCTTLKSRVLALETIKTTQAMEINSLKRRVKKLEKRNKSRTDGLKRLYKVGLSRRVKSFEDEGLGDSLKSAKPKADKVVIQEPEQGTTTPTLTTTTDATTITAVSIRPRAKRVQDKGKGKMVEPEHVKKMSKKELLRVDEELAFKLQAEEEEERLAREKA
ncbi:hypothetical protein Tco_1028402 [Tanacetum coccineum]|uniref:Uncharacterized protein n=1 Tax=Tanacetum coccineum TaxID=301880 RepID=A0ABQ5G0Q4_9ASTR